MATNLTACPCCVCEEASSSLTGQQSTDLILSLCLLTLSGLFSGLTLGLMSLDVDGLEIIIGGGGEEVEYAQKVLPIRKKGNLLLCTLLLGNTLVNALIAILSASFTSGIVGALLSTGFIVIFGEIMPQSVCSRYGLMIGAKTAGIVKLFMLILSPIAYPISAVLDWVLGEEMGVVYTKRELEKLVELHMVNVESEITSTDTTLLKGALKFSSVKVKDIMTERVLKGPGGYTQGIFMLDVNGRLDFDTILEMYKRGHTRVPICDGDPQNPQTSIVGLVLTKDLMLVDPDDQLETRTLLHYCGRPLRSVSEELPLNQMLEMLISGGDGKGNQTHLFFVQPDSAQRQRTLSNGACPAVTTSRGEHPPFFQPALDHVIGLVTLEDVLEELIQKEIIDETDEYQQNDLKEVIPRGKREVQELQEREAFFRAMVQKGPRKTRLSGGEVDALASFLCNRLEPFRQVVQQDETKALSAGKVPITRIRELLMAAEVPSPLNKYRDRVCKTLEMTGFYHTILKFPDT